MPNTTMHVHIWSLRYIHSTDTIYNNIYCHHVILGNSSGNERRLFLDEIRVMKKVSDGYNPHVLKMIGCVTATLPIMLLMQFVPHGSLKDYLRAMKPSTEVRQS